MAGTEYFWKVAILVMALTGAGCGSTRPPAAELELARQTIDMANELRADEYAPLEMRFARERLDAAKMASVNRDQANALYQAVEATLNAQLAIVKTRAAQARDELAQVRQEYDRLELEAAAMREGDQ